MADVKKCDRCGKIYTNYEKRFHFRCMLLTHIELWDRVDSRIRYDLCDECCDKLAKFLDNKE